MVITRNLKHISGNTERIIKLSSEEYLLIGEYTLQDIKTFKTLENVIYIALPMKYSPLLDKVALYTRLTDLMQDTNLSEYKGRGVIIGIADSGIDYTHPAFRGRILEIHDLTTGEVCYKEEIEKGNCNQRDTDGHGTHVAGIAAGDHEVYRGIAPEAELIVVKIGNEEFREDKIIEALDILAKRIKAYGKPGVINLSLGTPLGPHDGTDPISRFIESIVNTYKIPVVVAAGNWGNEPIHDKLNLFQENTSSFDVIGSWAYVDIWIMGTDSVELTINSPCQAVSIREGDTKLIDLGNCGTLAVSFSGRNPLNGDKNVFIKIDNVNENFRNGWSVSFTPIDVKDGEVHLWGENVAFASPDYSYTISSLASSSSVISVGSFTSKVNVNINPYSILGSISNFSSIGPSRRCSYGCKENLKPDIVAPGELVCSAYPLNIKPLIDLCFYEGFNWMQGTSMSAPAVTGAVALLLQVEHTLTPSEVKEILINNAYKDSFTTQKPNNVYGHGKLDIYKSVSSLLEEREGFSDRNTTERETLNVSSGGGGCTSQGQVSIIYLITFALFLKVIRFLYRFLF
ncbi:hypothetical protein JCM9492_07200 [Aquifex pyrophilus]